MSTPREIFLTGATGYIGGDVLYTLVRTFPASQLRISALIRDKKKAAIVASSYPDIRQISGDLSDTDLVEEESAKSDIVVHCASLDDLQSSNAIARGLAKRQRPGPAFWIAISGTDSIGWKTISKASFGEQEPEIYSDDDDGLDGVAAVPDDAPHRDVEKTQLAAATDAVKVAIVSGPCIYGHGRGPCNQRSVQLPDLARFTLRNGAAFQINRGLNRWPNIHIHDFSDLFIQLVGEALQGGGAATWGEKGYYFAENGTHVWKDIAEKVAQEAHSRGYIPEAKVVTLTAEQIDEEMKWSSLIFGTDSVCKAVRARKLLNWRPSRHSIEDEIAETVAIEARALELEVGVASKA